MQNLAIAGGALRCRHVPLPRRGGDQHFARGRAGPAQVVLRRSDRAARARRGVAPDAVFEKVHSWRDKFGAHPAPVAFELFGNEHGEPGHRALAHFRTRDPDCHRLIRRDRDPARDFRRTPEAACALGKGNGKAQREPAGRSAGSDKKHPAIEIAAAGHATPSFTVPAGARPARLTEQRLPLAGANLTDRGCGSQLKEWGMEKKQLTLDRRIRAIEERLEIYNLIAGNPPSPDTGNSSYAEAVFTA